MQHLVDGMSAEWKKQRSETQMTLGKLIEALEAKSPDAEVMGFADPHSYRGYYSDLALEPTRKLEKVSKLLAIARSAMGETYQGYKGGDYDMGKQTPVWFAFYGSCGEKLMALGDDGEWEVAEDE